MEINLTTDEVILLVCSLDSYMCELTEREKRSDYWFRSHMLEKYKQEEERNRVLLLSRMRHVDTLKERLLSYIPQG